MWAVVVTNQGTPVELVLVNSQDELDAAVTQIRREWQLTAERNLQVLEHPSVSFVNTAAIPASVAIKKVTVFTDSRDTPRYFLTVVSGVKSPAQSKVAKYWQYCPDCGCSWLSHLHGPASLGVEDWDSCACTECGCEKALNL